MDYELNRNSLLRRLNMADDILLSLAGQNESKYAVSEINGF